MCCSNNFQVSTLSIYMSYTVIHNNSPDMPRHTVPKPWFQGTPNCCQDWQQRCDLSCNAKEMLHMGILSPETKLLEAHLHSRKKSENYNKLI